MRGLIWRSHWDKVGFFARENRTLGEQLQDRGAEALLDMRVRTGGSHHQKFVVIRHRDDPARDVAFVGGIDLAHTRRDDARHLGDPQAAADGGGVRRAPAVARRAGRHPVDPAVHDVETVFRERWEDPTPLSRNPIHWFNDKIRRLDLTPDPLPDAGATAATGRGRHPRRPAAADLPQPAAAAATTRSPTAASAAWPAATARPSSGPSDDHLRRGPVLLGASSRRPVRRPPCASTPDLHVVVVLPLRAGPRGLARASAQLLGREYSLRQLIETAPERVAAYGIENDAGTPVYVHAKVCVMDDVWASVGSDNFNRRSWTHDSELSAVVVDHEGGDHSAYARRLRLRLMAEHLGRLGDVDEDPDDGNDNLLDVMADCVDAAGAFAAFRECATALDDWHSGGRRGPRPPGRLRWLHVPDVSTPTRWWARVPLRTVHDPDGRPRALRRTSEF